ncbi:MAG: M20/M25/M40 family metallo-hydrolase [Deltaproteobacteria bacterium]|nr:M20/M25/M40 family metallo-hydrolase [Deltaproteobacteria bacterium]
MLRPLVVAAVIGTAAVPVAAPAAACPPPDPAEGCVPITIGTDALPLVRAVNASHGACVSALEFDDGEGVALAMVSPDALEELSRAVHEEHHRCGGFIVHDSYDDAMLALQAAPQPRQVAYTIDRGSVVTAVLPQLDKARILSTIRELSAMPNRYYQSPHGAAASVWLRDRWRSFAAHRPDVTVELVDHGWAQQSVVLRIPGGAKRSEVVVLGGHLDSINARRRGDDVRAPGADDDASGIATLSEVVRVLLASDYRPERTIEVMAYAAEEVGLRGSQAIARDYQRRGIDVVGALQLDMTNYKGSDRDIWLMKDFTNAAQNDFVIKLIETYTGATYGLDACGYACSDHASWYRTGVPASMPFEARMRDANRAIHTVEDTAETCGDNAEHAEKFARLAASYAIEMGKGSLAAAHGQAQTCAGRGCERSPSRLPILLANALLALACLAFARRTIR